MLQQTQVGTALPYWERWMARFPTVGALAGATEQEVLSAWQGLGYYQRAKRLLDAARLVEAKGWPANAAEWQSLPGVGRYTAAALASITLGEPAAVVDGNVERVFARFIRSSLSGGPLTRAAYDWAEGQIDSESPGDWNQAMMELGARICTPRSASCNECPLATECESAFRSDRHELPTKAKKKPSVDLEWHYAASFEKVMIGLQKIEGGLWWAGMWQLPRIETAKGVPYATVRHTVTHHRIASHGYLTDDMPDAVSWFTLGEVAKLPLPAAQRKLVDGAFALLQVT